MAIVNPESADRWDARALVSLVCFVSLVSLVSLVLLLAVPGLRFAGHRRPATGLPSPVARLRSPLL